MARNYKYKLNKDGYGTLKCPNGFTTFTHNRLKRMPDDCMLCKYRIRIDFENQTVACGYVKKKG